LARHQTIKQAEGIKQTNGRMKRADGMPGVFGGVCMNNEKQTLITVQKGCNE
jgi:hypothetical protein